MAERTMYYAVLGTRRDDMGESVAALLSTEALAREVARRMADGRPWLTRCRVRQVWLTRDETATIVGCWGREDAARGEPIELADRILPPYRAIYLAGYQAGAALWVRTQRGTDPT